MREILRKTQLTLLLALGVFPVVLVLFAYAAPQLLPYGWMFPAVYTALTLLSFLIRGKWRIVWGVLGAALLIAPCALLANDKAVTIGIGYSALLLWSLQIAGWDADKELPGLWIGILAGIQLTAQVVPILLPALMPYQNLLRAVFFVFSMLFLLSLNRGSLVIAGGVRRRVSRVVRTKNFLLTAGLFGVALLFALIPSLLGLLKLVFEWILRLWLRSLSQTEADTPVSGTPEEPQFELGQDLVTRQTPQWVFTVMGVLALLVAVSLGVFLAVRIVKKLWRLARQWLRAFMEKATAEAVDYEDEISDTRDGKLQGHAVRKRRRPRAVDERKLTPQQRVRYRYARWLYHHPEKRAGSTARENLSPNAAEVYERARYSSHPISPEEAEQFKAQTK